jgi:integrase
MEADLAAGHGIVSFNDYIGIIKNYLTPFFGNYAVTSVDYKVIDEFVAWRTKEMGKALTRSTALSHNAALNRVFDEAVIRNFLSEANRPKLEATGKKSDRRPAFDLTEVRKLLGSFDGWIEKARNERSKEWRQLLRDYVEVLLDTGARPGDELMNLKWKQIKYSMKPVEEESGEYNIDPSSGEGFPIVNRILNRSVEMTVSGKTGTRQILGMYPTVKAFVRILKRNYGIKNIYLEPFKGVAATVGEDFVFRTKSKEKPESFQKMFEEFLKGHKLLVDPRTEQKRVFYSLRHTYATFALTHDQVPIHTLAKQMGTSVLMIEKHYSHLKVVQAIEQLRGYETRKLLSTKSVISALQEDEVPRMAEDSKPRTNARSKPTSKEKAATTSISKTSKQ